MPVLDLATRSPLTAEDDVLYMQQALALARLAAQRGEVPIGAVVVTQGTVVGIGHNAPISSADPTAHAEIVALRDAAAAQGNYRLPGAQLFVTAEPCLMCVGAMLHARIATVVYGCPEPKTGALRSRLQIEDLGLPVAELQIRSGVCEQESRALLQGFFRARRGA